MLDVARALDGITHTDHVNYRLNLNTKYKHLKQTTFNLLRPTNEAWGKVMFLHLSVILFTGGWLPSMHHMSHDQGSASGDLHLGGLHPEGSASRWIKGSWPSGGKRGLLLEGGWADVCL